MLVLSLEVHRAGKSGTLPGVDVLVSVRGGHGQVCGYTCGQRGQNQSSRRRRPEQAVQKGGAFGGPALTKGLVVGLSCGAGRARCRGAVMHVHGVASTRSWLVVIETQYLKRRSGDKHLT